MPTPEEEGRAELVEKLIAHAEAKLGKGLTPAKWQQLFSSYDRNKDGLITASELTVWLDDADVGNFLTRQMWVEGIMGRVDVNGDGVSLAELMETLKRGLADPDLVADGLKRVKDVVDDMTPRMPSFDFTPVLLAGLALMLLARK
jgi:hypothetical protein